MNALTRIIISRCHYLSSQKLSKLHLVNRNLLSLASRFSSEANYGDVTQDNPSQSLGDGNNVSPEWNVQILQEEQDIINAFNTLNQAQLYKYRHLSARLSKAITDERESGGSFKDLGDMLRVKGMGRRTLDRLVSEGLRPRGIRIEPLTRFSYAVSGNEQISQERLQEFETILTMDIGLKSFAWLHMDRGRNVRDWQVADLVDIHPGKYDPVAYLKALQRVLDEMPQADLYILEHRSYDKTSRTAYHVTLFLRTLESILYGLLNSSYASTGELQCVSLSKQRVGKHFGLLVGTRRKSGREIVQTLLEGPDVPTENPKVLVKFRPEDSEMFANSNLFEKELLANSVLKGVTFFDVFIDNKE